MREKEYKSTPILEKIIFIYYYFLIKSLLEWAKYFLEYKKFRQSEKSTLKEETNEALERKNFKT